jgi:hypothetical protein
MVLQINSLFFLFLNAFLCAAEIIVPSTVQAGTAVDVTINQDLWNYDTEFVSYVRIYLALKDHWGEQCKQFYSQHIVLRRTSLLTYQQAL